jgi:hypothetical protein
MTRVRSIEPPPLLGSFKLLRNGSVINTQITTNIQYSKEITDVVTPDYYNRKRRGEIINSPMTLTEVDVTSGGGSGTFAIPGNVYTTEGDGSMTQAWLQRKGYPSGIEYAELDRDLMEGVAKSKALGNLDRSPYSFAEDIGELRETFELLRNPLKTWRNLHYALTKRARQFVTTGRARSVSHALALAWAEYRFALLPTIRSVFELSKALKAADEPVPVRRRAFGTVKATSKKEQPDLRKHFGGGYDSYFHSSSRVGSAKAYIIYEVSDPVLDWRWKYGLRWRDIPETAWALYPYSFMVDRVTNISTALRGLSALADPKVSILTGGVVWKESSRENWLYTDQYDPPYVVSVAADLWQTREFLYDRNIWAPTVVDAFAPVNWGGLVRDATKIADLAALIRLRIPGSN